MTDFPPDYCPYCGTELPGDGPKHRCPDCGSGVFHSPAVAAAVAVVDRSGAEPRVLLGERGVAPAEGRFSTPGGHVDFGESPAEAAARELEEESGLSAGPGDLELLEARDLETVVPEPGVTDEKQVICVDFALALADAEGEPGASDDLAELRWVSEESFDGVDWAYTDDAAVCRAAIDAVEK